MKEGETEISDPRGRGCALARGRSSRAAVLGAEARRKAAVYITQVPRPPLSPEGELERAPLEKSESEESDCPFALRY